MAFNKLEFTKSWLSPADFPTEEDSEPQVRADLQLLHDETKNGLNGLIDELESPDAAESIGAVDETGAKTTVQALLRWLTALFSGVTRLDRTLEGEAGQDAVPTSAAVREALDGVILGDLSATGGGYILQNVWLATRHTPAGKRIAVGAETNTIVLRRIYEGDFVNGMELAAEVYRTESLIAGPDGKPVPGEVTKVLVADGSDELAGFYWSKNESFSPDTTYFTPETSKAYVVKQENEGEEDQMALLVNAKPVTVEDYEAQNGVTELLYGAPGTWPSSGYGENPAAAPYEGYLYQALGPFRQLPLYVGQGGDITVLAPDTVLYVPQILTEAQQAQARANIGAAAVGEGGGMTGMDKDEVVAAVLAALPNAEEAEF